jgi:hypothetical protein
MTQSDRDWDIEGGRIRRLGQPKAPDDAARLEDVQKVWTCVQGLENRPAGGGGFPFGGGRGQQGTTGVQGIPGNQGQTGVQGETGLGTTGLEGPTGVQGATGIQGITGIQGSTGQGATGIRGATGPGGGDQGVTGVQGTTGIQGTTGAQGATGVQGATGIQGATGAQGQTGVAGATGVQGVTGLQGAGTLYQFEIGPVLDTFTIPFTDAASEIVSSPVTLTNFRGRRGVPGSAGTTTIQLELNGIAVGGAVLSWTPVDAAFALKTVGIALAVVAGDRLSIRLTSAETGGEDVFAEAD